MKTQVVDEPPSELVRAIKTFRMRSPKRDVEIDAARMSSVLKSVEDVLQHATAERSGLIERVRTILRQPEAVLERTLQRQEPQPETFAQEWAKAKERLGALERHISRLKFLRGAILVEISGRG